MYTVICCKEIKKIPFEMHPFWGPIANYIKEKKTGFSNPNHNVGYNWG